MYEGSKLARPVTTWLTRGPLFSETTSFSAMSCGCAVSIMSEFSLSVPTTYCCKVSKLPQACWSTGTVYEVEHVSVCVLRYLRL